MTQRLSIQSAQIILAVRPKNKNWGEAGDAADIVRTIIAERLGIEPKDFILEVDTRPDIVMSTYIELPPIDVTQEPDSITLKIHDLEMDHEKAMTLALAIGRGIGIAPILEELKLEKDYWWVRISPDVSIPVSTHEEEVTASSPL